MDCDGQCASLANKGREIIERAPSAEIMFVQLGRVGNTRVLRQINAIVAAEGLVGTAAAAAAALCRACTHTRTDANEVDR